MTCTAKLGSPRLLPPFIRAQHFKVLCVFIMGDKNST